MSFDRDIGRLETHCSKYSAMEAMFGIDPNEGLGMWVADSDYPSAPAVQEALHAYVDLGGYRYGADEAGYHAAITWWQGHRHGWTIQPDWIVTTQGLGHAIAMVFDTFTEIGAGVAYFTPVYHEFRNKTLRCERRPVELPLALIDGRYQLDWDRAEAAIDPGVKVLIHCAPQNPSGRVWSVEESRQIAEFAARHDLILISDEVHADIVYPGGPTHVPMDVAAPEHRNRTITLSAASKAFNLPALRCGQAIVPDDKLRAALQRRLAMTEYKQAAPGIVATKAAFSPEGEAWLKDQIAYLTENRRIFDAAIDAIPGLWSMPLESTFLAWVDFSGTGMDHEEFTARLRDDAKIAASPGPGFGTGGETFARFNLAMPRHLVEDAVARMQRAFADLQ
ncbi:aminotransferase class I/II-fold pyridoxal phosphate-dependent enzyme [Rhodobacterales bacterium HKCCE3408]|nr:aminotransferase class I/II-fold pyridoxal phosphate-dependent enzyme [Rhodobacterales bacterium HKCCE3408]